MDINVGQIIEIVNSIPGGLTISGILLWIIPRFFPKEKLAGIAKKIVRTFLPKINISGEGWRATVLFIAKEVIDEADDIFEKQDRIDETKVSNE